MPEKPVFVVSKEIISGSETQGDELFMCYGQVGHPSGHIKVEANFYGNFTTILSPADENNDLAFFVGSPVRNGTQCAAYEYVKFALKANATKLENHNKILRCVIVPAPELSSSATTFTDQVMKVLDSK